MTSIRQSTPTPRIAVCGVQLDADKNAKCGVVRAPSRRQALPSNLKRRAHQLLPLLRR